MMRRRALALGGIAWARTASAQQPGLWTLRPIEHPAFNWRLVAQSDLIVRGILAMPTLAISRLYKGSERRAAVDLRYPGRPGCGPAPEALAALNARDGVFHLAATPPGFELVGCSPESATAFSLAYERDLRKEAERQAAMVRRVTGLLADRTPPFEDSVAAMVRTALAGDNQSALRGLLRSGLAAAPAMIRRLDDRRALPRKEFIEGQGRHHLDDVAELMMFALGLVAKDAGLGRIADAWRVWLGYSLGLEAG